MEKDSKKLAFVPPEIGKAYRLSEVPPSKNIVIKTIAKARREFPKMNQRQMYSKSEMNLFDWYAYMMLSQYCSVSLCPKVVFHSPLAEPLLVRQKKKNQIFDFHVKEVNVKSESLRLHVITKRGANT